jgi:pimeloyl-ACP methyl ester carboxylesterase
MMAPAFQPLSWRTHNEHHHPSHRRRCLRLAALAGQAHAAAPATFSTIKQVNAGDLNVGYVDEGPANGPVVILLHGWPYDINSYVDVVPKLTAQGYRVIVPHLRGYGTTRFLDANTPRNGEPAALAADVIALMDALKIDKATLAGYDWGARTADIVAALWPQRVKGLVSVSGYLIGSQEAGKQPLPPEAELQWWYQFYFATERGRAGYEKNHRDFAKLIWKLASPQWKFDDATYARSAVSLDNPDHAAVTVSNYRWRLGLERAKPNTRSWKRSWPSSRASRCRPSPWKATPTARRIRNRPLTPSASPASTSTS